MYDDDSRWNDSRYAAWTDDQLRAQAARYGFSSYGYEGPGARQSLISFCRQGEYQERARYGSDAMASGTMAPARPVIPPGEGGGNPGMLDAVQSIQRESASDKGQLDATVEALVKQYGINPERARAICRMAKSQGAPVAQILAQYPDLLSAEQPPAEDDSGMAPTGVPVMQPAAAYSADRWSQEQVVRYAASRGVNLSRPGPRRMNESEYRYALAQQAVTGDDWHDCVHYVMGDESVYRYGADDTSDRRPYKGGDAGTHYYVGGDENLRNNADRPIALSGSVKERKKKVSEMKTWAQRMVDERGCSMADALRAGGVGLSGGDRQSALDDLIEARKVQSYYR
jgi:hypothetical protein